MQDRFKFRYYNKHSNKMVEPTNYQNVNAIYECLGKKYQTRYISTVIAEGEKVGNLYENPKLLESEVK